MNKMNKTIKKIKSTITKQIKKNEEIKFLHYHYCNIGDHGWECNENHIYINTGRIKDLFCETSPCDKCVNNIVFLLEIYPDIWDS